VTASPIALLAWSLHEAITSDDPIVRLEIFLIAWVTLAVVALVVAVLLRARLAAMAKVLGLFTAVLVATNMIPFGLSRSSDGSGASSPSTTGKVTEEPSPTGEPERQMPDIYYIVPEDYGDERTLRARFGVDTRFLDRYLENEGFYVADASKTNYQNTHLALSASMNLDYPPNFLGKLAKSDEAVMKTLQGFTASKFLQTRGYRYVHLGYWWPPTAVDPTADVEISSGSLLRFSKGHEDTKVFPKATAKQRAQEDPLHTRTAKYDHTRQELQDIVRVAKLRGPKFVFAHLGIPHAPYVFDRRGRFVADSLERDMQKFADQAYYTAKQLELLVRRLLDATDRKAVIILQTDEGGDPVRVFRTFRVNEKVEARYAELRNDIATGRFGQPGVRAELLAKYRILNAYFLPGVSQDLLYPSITPVNTFRLVFDLYFGTAFGLLPDRIWAKVVDPPRFVDITQRVEEG
jgi:hypothetical protein